MSRARPPERKAIPLGVVDTTILGGSVEYLLALRSKVFRGLGDESRLAILLTLADGQRSVRQVVEATGLTQPNVSGHLACLHECGLVRRQPLGRFVYYELAGPEIEALLAGVDGVLRRSAEQIAACLNYERPVEKR